MIRHQPIRATILMDLPLTNEHCPTCMGSGKVIDTKKMGAALKKIRLDAGLNMRQLAERLKISSTHVSDLELGHRTPSHHVLAAWLRVAAKPEDPE